MTRPDSVAAAGTAEGMLLVDKPAGVTSHDVVKVVRRAYGERSIGHLGTLDPFATGLLILLVGRCTRLASFIETEPKTYEATIRFGSETDTDDCTGVVTRVAALPDPAALPDAMHSLTGRILQLPPDYSAKSVGGERAYTAARRGAPLELSPVEVIVHQWIVRKASRERAEVTIVCGTGTYVRALARDLGRAVASAAHLEALRRIRAGEFDVADAVTLDLIGSAAPPPLTPLRVVAGNG